MQLKKIRLTLYYIRAIVLLYIIMLLTKVLFVETPPLFSVAAIIKDKNKLLFVNLSHSRGLGLPGGIIQKGETLEKALKREVFEETGLTITNYRYFTSEVSSFKGLPTVSVSFIVEVSGNIRGSEEGSVAWMKPEEAFTKLYYKDAKGTIKKFLEQK